MHDIFISYEHTSKSIADNIVNVLESNKIRCWYAPRDVVGDYATSICDAISTCKIFILVLSENSSNSNHCLNEVEMAYMANIENKQSTIIMPFKVDNKSLNRAMEYYVKRLHWIDATTKSLDTAIQELLEKVSKILGIELNKQEEVVFTKAVRHKNNYDSTVKYERERLQKQLEISKNFDQPVYDKYISKLNNAVVLDIGSGSGRHIIDRLADKPNVFKIIGLEYNQDNIIMANELGCEKAKFYQCDLEDPSFPSKLQKILEENNVDKVDFLNLSMIVLHLKNPFSVFATLRKVLKKGGIIFIKDIDDGINFGYPDPEEWLDRVFNICLKNEESGYRHSGRQIHSLLHTSGYRDIVLEKSGLNTIGFDFDQKQALFDTYFEFVLGDLKLMADKYTNSKEIQEDYKWLSEKYEEIEALFHQDSFIFSLGFMIYVAKK